MTQLLCFYFDTAGLLLSFHELEMLGLSLCLLGPGASFPSSLAFALEVGLLPQSDSFSEKTPAFLVVLGPQSALLTVSHLLHRARLSVLQIPDSVVHLSHLQLMPLRVLLSFSQSSVQLHMLVG